MRRKLATVKTVMVENSSVYILARPLWSVPKYDSRWKEGVGPAETRDIVDARAS